MKKRVRNRILSFVLVLLMVFTNSMPFTVWAKESEAPVSVTGGEISAFTELSEEMASITVPLGTSIEHLNLPSSLMAKVYKEVELNEEMNDGEALEITSEQEILTLPVKEWVSSPTFDPEAMGTYIFTPVLDEGWILANGVELPTITVQVTTGINTPTVYSTWGDGGIIDLSTLPSTDESNTDSDTPWAWNSTAKTLTLTGPGPYTMEGTANGTARIVVNSSQDVALEINGQLKAPDEQEALAVLGNMDLFLTGTGSVTGGYSSNSFAGAGIDASSANGNIYLGGGLEVAGGIGIAGNFGIVAQKDIVITGNIIVTGGNGATTSGGGGTSGIGIVAQNLVISGKVHAIGGNDGIFGGSAVGLSNGGKVHFTDSAATLILSNGNRAGTSSLDLTNQCPDTRWSINSSAIAGGGSVTDQDITINAPAFPSTLTVQLMATVGPSITTNPVSQTITQGQSATFSVVASGIQLSYQWQVDKQDGLGFRDVTDGTGEATAQYTTQATDIGMNGYTYRVIVSNPHDSATSSAAVLRVQSPTSSGGAVHNPIGKQPNMPTVAKQTISGKLAKKVLTANITEQMAKDAIAIAEKDAKLANKTANGIAVMFHITDSGAYESLTVTIEDKALDRLKDAGVKFVKIGSSIFDISFNTKAINHIDKNSGGTVTLSAKKVTKLSKAATTAIGKRRAFDITISYKKNGKKTNISALGGGTATIGIAAKAPSSGTGILYGVHVKTNGKVEWLQKSSYTGGKLVFTRSSLSVYGVGLKANNAFIDTKAHWAKDSIDFIVSRKLITGTTNVTYVPDRAISRADFVMALGKLSGANVSSYKKSSFTDVKDNDATMPYIEWAVVNKIITASGDKQFSPNGTITREQIAVILQNYAKTIGYELPIARYYNTFADNHTISYGVQEAVTATIQAGIMASKEGNKFDPASNASRAETAVILHRFISVMNNEENARGWVRNDSGQYQYYNEAGKLVKDTKVDGYIVDKDGVRK